MLDAGHGQRLVQRLAVEIHLARVPGVDLVEEPVPTDALEVRVARPEQGVRHGRHPDPARRARVRTPVGDHLSTRDRHRLEQAVRAQRSLVGDRRSSRTAARRVHPLAVHAFVHDDGVPRLSQRRGSTDREQGGLRGSGRGVGTRLRDVQLHAGSLSLRDGESKSAADH